MKLRGLKMSELLKQHKTGKETQKIRNNMAGLEEELKKKSFYCRNKMCSSYLYQKYIK